MNVIGVIYDFRVVDVAVRARAVGQRTALSLFAEHLRRLRLVAGLTQEECASGLGCSAQHVGNVETARRLPSETFALAADDLLGGQTVLHGLWRLARDEAGVGPHAETVAVCIETYQAHLVPPALQCESYAEAVVGGIRPALPPDRLAALLTGGASRRAIMHGESPPRLWAVVDEAVLHRELGGRPVLREQLAFLIGLASSHRVTLQVLPFGAPTSPALGQSFTLLSFAEAPAVVCVDTVPEQPAEIRAPGVVARHRAVFDHLREAALPEADSLTLVRTRLRAVS